jgi:hypothetical protein
VQALFRPFEAPFPGGGTAFPFGSGSAASGGLAGDEVLDLSDQPLEVTLRAVAPRLREVGVVPQPTPDRACGASEDAGHASDAGNEGAEVFRRGHGRSSKEMIWTAMLSHRRSARTTWRLKAETGYLRYQDLLFFNR